MKKVLILMILVVTSFSIFGIIANAANVGVTLLNRYGSTITGMSYDGTNSAALQSMLEAADGDTASENFVGWTSIEWEGLKKSSEAVSYIYNMWLAQNYFTISVQQNYELKDYLVRWYNGTSLLKSEYVDHGYNATPPANPSKTGYTFTGWDSTYTGVTSNLDIYAEFQILKFYVTFKDWDSSTISMQLIDYGSPATPPNPPPSRAGYRFIGWDTSYYNIRATTTTNALYSVLYTITFALAGGSPSYTAFTYIDGEGINLNNYVPVKEEYSFVGWYADWTNSAYEDGLFTSASTLHPSNVTFTATWSASATYQEGFEAGFNAGEDAGLEAGYKEGYDEAEQYWIDWIYNHGFTDTAYADTGSLSYRLGRQSVSTEEMAITDFIPGLVGVFFGFFFQLASISVLGISLLDILALIFSFGILIIIIKIFVTKG